MLKLHWLRIQSRTECKIACVTHTALTTGQPTYLGTSLNYYTPQCTLRSYNQYFLQQPRVSTEFAKRSFSYLAPVIWNNRPLDMRLSHTIPNFKRRFKCTYLNLNSFHTSLPPSSPRTDCLHFRISRADSEVLCCAVLCRAVPGTVLEENIWGGARQKADDLF